MGFELSHIREDGLLVAYADNATVIAQTYNIASGGEYTAAGITYSNE